MHAYQEKHGRLPPAIVYSEDGMPLHSWRVLILPFIEQEPLYKQFKLDEPWDSPHNLALLPQMPNTYAPTWDYQGKVGPHETVCHVFLGKGAAFEGKEGLRLPSNFPDGTGNTIMVIEAGNPVAWTKPEDIAYDPDGPLPELYTLFKDGFRVLTANSTGRWIPRDIDEQKLRAYITRNGKEDVTWE